MRTEGRPSERILDRIDGDFLLFELGGGLYALPSSDVQEIVRAVAVDPLPRAPRVVEGIINARGRVVPVLDIRARFGLAAKPVEPADHFILARTAGRTVALRADRALELRRFSPEEVQGVDELTVGIEPIVGVAKLDRLVLIHDLHAFLSEAEKVALDEALDGETPEEA